MQNAKDTQDAIRAAMQKFEAIVLHDRYFDPISQSQKYPHSITIAEVLKLAGVKSRATLHAEYHKDIRADLQEFIEDLKRKGGKRAVAETTDPRRHEGPLTPAARFEQLTQTVGALQYRILELEKQLEQCRKAPAKKNVVDIGAAARAHDRGR